MTIEKLFEKATRTKMRFQFKGLLSVEDLWDLTPNELDAIFKNLNGLLKQASEESLLQVKSSSDQELEAKIEIVKHMVNVKLREAEARANAKNLKAQEQKLLAILASKEEEDLQGKSPEDIRAMLDEIQKQKQQL
jgi:hypothetical protein